jgi:hypothetical protein
MIIPVLPQTPYNYSYLHTGGTEDVVVADMVPISDARTVALSVRIHEVNFASGAGFRFLIYGVDPSRTDATLFMSSTTIGDTGKITSASTNLVGLTSIISDPIYPFVRVMLRAEGASTTGNCYFELSADLVVRQASEMNGCSTREAAFCADMLELLHAEAPRDSGTLSQFSIGPTRPGNSQYCQLPPTTFPTESEYCSDYCPSAGFWCNLKKFAGKYSVKGYC